MPQFTDQERQQLAFLKTKKTIPGYHADADEEIAQIYHEAERREDLLLQQKALEESGNANKLSKIAIIVSVVSAVITTTISLLALFL